MNYNLRQKYDNTLRNNSLYLYKKCFYHGNTAERNTLAALSFNNICTANGTEFTK